MSLLGKYNTTPSPILYTILVHSLRKIPNIQVYSNIQPTSCFAFGYKNFSQKPNTDLIQTLLSLYSLSLSLHSLLLINSNISYHYSFFLLLYLYILIFSIFSIFLLAPFLYGCSAPNSIIATYIPPIYIHHLMLYA